MPVLRSRGNCREQGEQSQQASRDGEMAIQHGVKPGQAPLLPQEGSRLYPDTLRSNAALRSAGTRGCPWTEPLSRVFWGAAFPSARLAPAPACEVLPPKLG